MARMRLLDLVRPFALALPEVELPYQKVDATERLVYTVCAAILFILLAEVPIYGLPSAADPIAWLRAGLGMSSGTLAELGVLPIVLSGVTFQVLAGLRRINVSLDLRSDRALFQSLQKLTALGIAAVLSVLLALGGLQGSSPRYAVFAAMQLFAGSAAIIYLDEILTKGYGVVTGVVLFTLVRSAQEFAWTALSLASVEVPGLTGTITYGLFPSLIFNLKNRSWRFALADFAFRTEAPNVFDVAIAIAVFMAALYLGMVRQNMQIRSTRMRAQASAFPVRLIYAGAQPVLFTASVVAAAALGSYALSGILGGDALPVRVLGVWDRELGVPRAGLASYLVPQLSGGVLVSLVRAVLYTSLFGALGAYVGNVWTQSSGFAPLDIAKQFKENSIVLVGKRDVSAIKELRRIIPLAATLGGLIMGLLAASADVLASSGWGTTMIIAALGVFNVFESLAQDGIVGPDGLNAFM